jgi:hypothetical protein
MHVTTVLPSNYTPMATIDLMKNKIAIAAAVVSFVVMVLAASWLVVKFSILFRPAALESQGFSHILTKTPEYTTFTFTLQLFISILLALVLVLLLHELVHGLVFWRLAGKRPEFNFKALGIYVASPSDVYYPRNKYLTVGIAPLVLLTIIGLLLIVVVPAVLMPILIFFVAFNAAGSSGDLIMIALLLSYSSDTLMQDVGSSVIVYGP